MTFPVVQSVVQIGPVSIHWYGLLVVGGMYFGYLVVRYLNLKSSHRYPLSTIDSLAFSLIIWGFVGARLYHVLNEPIYYWNHPIDIVKVWNGGLAIHGAILAGVFVVIYFSRKSSVDSSTRNKKTSSGEKFQITNDKFQINSKSQISNRFGFWSLKLVWGLVLEIWNFLKELRVPFFRITDILVIGLALGQAIGRWGNYFNQELFGRPTNGFFKVLIDTSHRPVGFESVAYYHPTFFYESVLNVILFVVLFFIYCRLFLPLKIRGTKGVMKSKVHNSSQPPLTLRGGEIEKDCLVESSNDKIGLVTSCYLIGYGLIRFFVDFLRIDPRPFFGGLYLSQWVSLVMVVIGVVIWYTRSRNSKPVT